MIIRFVYPKLNLFYAKRGMNGAEQLVIAGPADDGRCWFGIREAIENYCEEYREFGISIQDIEWLVKAHPSDGDYESIVATDIDDWVKQFNDLKVEFDLIEG